MARYILILLIWLSIRSNAQDSSVISNSTIKYGVGRAAVPIDSTGYIVISSNYIIQVEIADSIKMALSKLSREQWLQYLQNPKTDWAANLLLYDLYKKDALLFVTRTREEWLIRLKNEDIGYWNRTLK